MNGFKNWETWNVALWINNDPGFYSLAQDAQEIGDFIDSVYSQGVTHTPDGAEFDGPELDYERLDDLIREIN
jgi:hypothetical protein